MLRTCGMGFGALAFNDLLARDSVGGEVPVHFAPKAKYVIHLFMNGGAESRRHLRSETAVEEAARKVGADEKPSHRTTDRKCDGFPVPIPAVR